MANLSSELGKYAVSSFSKKIISKENQSNILHFKENAYFDNDLIKNLDDDEIKSRPRNYKHHDMRRSYTNSNFRHKNSKKLNNLSLDSSNSLMMTKPIYDKIIFNISIPKYIGKEQKVLEVSSSGYFMIYKKGKVKDII
jgi:hypothetical protein